MNIRDARGRSQHPHSLKVDKVMGSGLICADERSCYDWCR